MEMPPEIKISSNTNHKFRVSKEKFIYLFRFNFIKAAELCGSYTRRGILHEGCTVSRYPDKSVFITQVLNENNPIFRLRNCNS